MHSEMGRDEVAFGLVCLGATRPDKTTQEIKILLPEE
jgi:hypothetical protein